MFEIPTNYNLYSRELQQIKDYRDSFYERIPDLNKTQSKFASIAFEALNYSNFNAGENSVDCISMNLGISLNDLQKSKNRWVRFYRNQDDENNNEVLCFAC